MRILTFGGLHAGVIAEYLRVVANAIVAALVREFGMDEAFAAQVAAKARSINIARWMAKNGVNASNLDEIAGLVSEFDRLKPKIKASGQGIDLVKYDLPSLRQVIERVRSAPVQQTEQQKIVQFKKSLPSELVSIPYLIIGKAERLNPNLNQQKAKFLAFDWILRIFEGQVAKYVAWGKDRGMPGHAKELAIRKVNEDRREYAMAAAQYIAFLMDKENVRPLSEFQEHYLLTNYVESFLTPEEIEMRYTIDPSAVGDVFKKIALPNGYQAIRVSKWDEQFADELCKFANWCVRNPSMFEQYQISEATPLYLLLKGKKQVGLLSLDLAEFKDVRDAPLGESSMIAEDELDEIFDAMMGLSKAEGKGIPSAGDFLAFMPWLIKNKMISPTIYFDESSRLNKMQDENAEDKGAGDTPRHTEEAINVAESTVYELISTYATEYMSFALGKIPNKKMLKLMDDVELSTRKRYENYEKYQGSSSRTTLVELERIWRMLGRIGETLTEQGEYAAISFFRDYLPEDFLRFANSRVPSGDSLYDESLLRNVIACNVDEGKKRQVMMKMYSMLLQDENYLSKNSYRLAGNVFVIDLPTLEKEKILRDETGFYLCSFTDNTVGAIGALRTQLEDIQRKLKRQAELLHIDPQSVTMEQAEKIFREMAGSGKWNWYRGDFDPDENLTPRAAQKHLDQMLRDYFGNQKWLFDMVEIPRDYAGFTYFLLRWNMQSQGLGESFGKKIMEHIESQKQSCRKIETMDPVAAWLRGQCMFVTGG